MILELLKLVGWALQAVGFVGAAELITVSLSKPCLVNHANVPVYVSLYLSSVVLAAIIAFLTGIIERPRTTGGEIVGAYLRWSIIFAVVGVAFGWIFIALTAHRVHIPC